MTPGDRDDGPPGTEPADDGAAAKPAAERGIRRAGRRQRRPPFLCGRHRCHDLAADLGYQVLGDGQDIGQDRPLARTERQVPSGAGLGGASLGRPGPPGISLNRQLRPALDRL
jgi:hypothetical protein